MSELEVTSLSIGLQLSDFWRFVNAGRGVHREYDNGKRKESYVTHGVNQLYSTLKNRNFTLKNGKLLNKE